MEGSRKNDLNFITHVCLYFPPADVTSDDDDDDDDEGSAPSDAAHN